MVSHEASGRSGIIAGKQSTDMGWYVKYQTPLTPIHSAIIALPRALAIYSRHLRFLDQRSTVDAEWGRSPPARFPSIRSGRTPVDRHVGGRLGTQGDSTESHHARHELGWPKC